MLQKISLALAMVAASVAVGCQPSGEPNSNWPETPVRTTTNGDGSQGNGSQTPAPVDKSLTSEYDLPGFATTIEDGRLWVFRAGCEELAEFKANGELGKHVTRIAAGPKGMTLKGPDGETLDAYMLTKPGFWVTIEDGRLWVFRNGCAELDEFRANGELGKHVTRIAAGPRGMTIKGPDGQTLDAYLAAGQ